MYEQLYKYLIYFEIIHNANEFSAIESVQVISYFL